MTPQYVEARRCGGGCHTPPHSCLPTIKIVRQVPVLLSSCGVSVGVCTKSCGVVTVEEDTHGPPADERHTKQTGNSCTKYQPPTQNSTNKNQS